MTLLRGALAATALALASLAIAADPLPARFAHLPESVVEVVTPAGSHRFKVWIAADDSSRALGLMHVTGMPADRGMLFLFESEHRVDFWMKDTPLSLDMLFIAADGRIVNIAENTTPGSLAPIESAAAVSAVLEVSGGTARGLGIEPGDRVLHPALGHGQR